MSKAFCIPGVFLIGAALVLLFLSSISLPYLPALDVARTKFTSGIMESDSQGITELRLGVWAYCFYNQDVDRTCTTATHAYSLAIFNEAKTANVLIGSSWTRGLAVHPVATGVAFIAFLLSLSLHHAVTLVASLFAFLASALSLIAFAIDIALFVYLKHEVNRLPDVEGSTRIGNGFWLTFVSFILLVLGGVTVCLGRRQRTKRTDAATEFSTVTPAETTAHVSEKDAAAPISEKKPFWAKFRKN